MPGTKWPTCTNLKAYSQAGPPRRPRAHAGAQGTPDRPTDPFLSEVNDNRALEAGACQEPLSQNVGLLSLASFWLSSVLVRIEPLASRQQKQCIC